MRVLEGSNRVRGGLMGILITLLVIGVGQSFTSVPMLFAEPTYYAYFQDTGGLSGGDKVRIAGVDIGQVKSFDIEGDKVKIGYTLSGTQIGTDSRAAIRTDTVQETIRTFGPCADGSRMMANGPLTATRCLPILTGGRTPPAPNKE